MPIDEDGKFDLGTAGLWTRAVLAGLVFTQLLKPMFFGMDTHENLNGIDHALRDFENRVWFGNDKSLLFENLHGDKRVEDIKPVVEPALLVDWRAKTVQLCQALVMGQIGPGDSVAFKCAEQIMDFLDDALLPRGEKGEYEEKKGEIWEKVRLVCEDAFMLRMQTRQASDVYEFTMPGTQMDELVQGIESEVKVVAVENGTLAEKTDRIACLLFGGLRRVRFVGGTHSVVVLEPAQLVVRRGRSE